MNRLFAFSFLAFLFIVGCGRFATSPETKNDKDETLSYKNRPEEGSWQPGAWPAGLVSLDGFTADEKNEVLNALDKMNAESGKTIIHLSDVGTGYPIYLEKIAPDPENKSRAGLALAGEDRRSVQISDILFTSGHRRKLFPVIAHELGHCAGLSHDPVFGEVMYRSSESLNAYKPEAFHRFFTRARQSVGL